MKALFITLCIICVIIPIIVYSVGTVKAVQFDANCISYLRVAGDSTSVVLAEKHVSKAVEYIENNNLTSGNTSVFVKRPTNDIGIWYENLKTAQAQLKELSVKEDLTELEESNALMKLRETFLTNDGSVSRPDSICFYPSHVAWMWSLCLIWLLWILAIIFGFCASEQY